MLYVFFFFFFYLLKSFAVPNFLPHTIIFFNTSRNWNWLTNRFFFSRRFNLLFFSSLCEYVCTSWSITSWEPFVVIHTHIHTIYLRSAQVFSEFYMQQNKTKAKQSKTTTKCISLLLVSNTARTHIFHPIQKYSIHQPHSLCAILYCTCVSIELVFFSFIRLFCSKNFCVLKFHCSIEFNGIRIFFFYIHTLRKKVTRLLFYCCVCIFFYSKRLLFSPRLYRRQSKEE